MDMAMVSTIHPRITFCDDQASSPIPSFFSEIGSFLEESRASLGRSKTRAMAW